MVDFAKHLKSRIDAIGKGSAASLVPQPRAPRAEKVVEAIPDITEVMTGPTLMRARKLVALVTEHKMAERAAKKAYEAPLETLKSLFEPVGKATVMVGETKVSYYPTTRMTLSKQLLLAQGVDPAVIAAAMQPVESWAMRIYLPGEDE